MSQGEFHVVPAAAVVDVLISGRREVLDIVRAVYVDHEAGHVVNPRSLFLRFPGLPTCRAIALPAYLGGSRAQVGIKWIASFPENHRRGLARASAVLVLNDATTGYPIACLEGASISAARTAASATLAAAVLASSASPGRIAFVGAGPIARTIVDYLAVELPGCAEVRCFDLQQVRAEALCAHAAARLSAPATVASTLAEALVCELVVFATTAAKPHVHPSFRFRPDQLVLNVSLRDLAPESLLVANNVVDDVDHCLTADTSPHLAEQMSGTRGFINGTLGAALTGHLSLPPNRATIFSPFGLGALDVAVGAFVLGEALRRGTAIAVPGFFGAEGIYDRTPEWSTGESLRR